ncbi:MAG: hypothetical protein ACYTG7_19605 [Planctomycetota bacterium]|jgi:hypothetical protein
MMNRQKFFMWAGCVALVMAMCAFPAFAQDCCGTCGGDKAACTKSCDSKASCGSSCSQSCQDKSCCGTCGGDKACASACASASAQSCGTMDMSAFMNCEICKNIFNQMDLMMACDYSVENWSEGLVMSLSCKQPEMLPRFRAYEKKENALADKYAAMSPKELKERVCPFCNRYFAFRRNGMKEERITTPTGTVVLARASNPNMLKNMHVYADQVHQMMASFDPSQFMAAANTSGQDCCGTCGGTCGGQAVASACPKTGKQGACTATAEASAACNSNMSPEMMQEMMNCTLCKEYMGKMDLMMDVKSSVHYLKNGMAMLNTVTDPGKVKAFQAFEQRIHDKIEKLKHMPYDEAKGKVCDLCQQFAELDHAGATMDWSDTPNGTMTVITADKEELVAKIKNIGKTFESMFPQM